MVSLIYMDIHGYTEERLVVQGKQIFVKTHAIKQARERGIAFPDQVFACLMQGKLIRFGKNGIKFVKRSNEGCVICVDEQIAQSIIIKTIERGN